MITPLPHTGHGLPISSSEGFKLEAAFPLFCVAALAALVFLGARFFAGSLALSPFAVAPFVVAGFLSSTIVKWRGELS